MIVVLLTVRVLGDVWSFSTEKPPGKKVYACRGMRDEVLRFELLLLQHEGMFKSWATSRSAIYMCSVVAV